MASNYNTLKTRIRSKFDYISAWNEHGDFIPLQGEIVVALVPSRPISVSYLSPDQFDGPASEAISTYWTTPEFLLKVGDGVTPISALQWVTAKAGDVYAWAKNEYLEWDTVNEENFLSGLSNYIKQNSKNLDYGLRNTGSIDSSAYVELTKTDPDRLGDVSSVASVLIPDVLRIEGSVDNGTLKLSSSLNRVFNGNILTEIDKREIISDYIEISSITPSDEQFVKSYALLRNGVQCGTSINIPKDFIINEAKVRAISDYLSDTFYQTNGLLKKSDISTIYRISVDFDSTGDWSLDLSNLVPTSLQADTDYTLSVGQKIIDIVVNTISNDVPGVDHLYIPVKDLLGDDLDASVSAEASKSDDEDFFNVVSSLSVTENDGTLESAYVGDARLNKIALSGNAKYLTQDEDDFLVLDCGSASELIENPFLTFIRFSDDSLNYFDFRGTINNDVLKNRFGLLDSSWNWINQPVEVRIGSNVTRIEETLFSNCNELTSIIIPNSVTYIGMGVFDSCTNLLRVSIPNSVTYIGMGSFYNCTYLESIKLPSRLTEIEENLFNECTNLEEVIIPNSVTKIGDNAFYGCTRLPSIVIPERLTYIGYEAFSGCTNLAFVTMKGKTREYVTEMTNYPWDLLPATSIICTDGTIVL